MEIYFLIILILSLLTNLIIYKNILNPTVIIRLTWIFSVFMLILFRELWGVSLSGATMLIFIVGFFFFDLGYMSFHFFSSNHKNKKLTNKNKVSFRKSLIILFLLIVGFIIIYYISYNLVVAYRNNETSGNFLIRLRYLMKYSNVNTSLIQFGIRMIETIGIVYFIYYIREENKSFKSKVIYLSIIFLSLIMMSINTGRFRYLAFIVMTIYIIGLKFIKNNKTINLKSQFKIIAIGIIMFIIFIIFFQTYGVFLGKGFGGLINNLAIYSSGGIVAFDLRWQDISKTSSYFGQAIFNPVYSQLENFFDLSFETNKKIGVLKSVYANNEFATNVYTFYRQQIIDFGVKAVPIIMFVLGAFFSYLNYKSFRENELGFWSALYAYFMFGIIISPFQDVFFTNTTFDLISIIIIFLMLKTKILYKKNIVQN